MLRQAIVGDGECSEPRTPSDARKKKQEAVVHVCVYVCVSSSASHGRRVMHVVEIFAIHLCSTIRGLSGRQLCCSTLYCRPSQQ